MAKNIKKSTQKDSDIFDLHIFPNGRVYFLDKSIVDEAIKQNKEVMVVCNAWSGGYNTIIGANLEPYDGKNVYMMYQYEAKDAVFTEEDLKKFYRVIFTPGDMIFMKTGDQATAYQANSFIDWDSKDEKIIERQEIWNFPEKYNGGAQAIMDLRSTVDEEYTRNHLLRTQDGEKKIRTLEAYGILKKEG